MTARRRGERGRRPVSVAVIGSGVCGIAAAVKLRAAGIRDVTIYDKADGIGGTWWSNTYPGCGVDVPSYAYSFTFHPYDWSRSHASQDEVQRYLEDVIDTFDLRSALRLSTEITSVTWEADAAEYVLVDADGGEHRHTVVVASVGLLSVPNWPDWPGLESFAGPVFHTSQWDHSQDLAGRRVAFVGTGSTGAQVVPALAGVASHLDVYQREPGWILPRQDRVYTAAERRRHLGSGLRRRASRVQFFVWYRRAVQALDVDSAQQQRQRAAGLDFIRSQIADPDVRAAVTPDYPFGCKRTIYSDTFYAALDRPDVDLHPTAVTRVTPSGVVAADGLERAADVLVVGTGFRPAEPLSTIAIAGSDGQKLQDAWGDTKGTFLGMTVPGFPNLFMTFGPNTNAGSIMALAEWQAGVIARTVRRLQRSDAAAVEATEGARDRYTAWIDRRLARFTKAQESGCHNYYHSASGRNVTQWPGNPGVYWAASRLLPRIALRLRGKG